MSECDVLIVGGGIAGASLGAELAGKVGVVIVEAESHCGFHATGRSAAFWLESYGGPIVARLAGASHAFLVNGGFLHRRGALHISEDSWADLPEGIACRQVERAELEQLVPGIRPKWRFAAEEPGCSDIDVAALHQHYLRALRTAGGSVLTEARFQSAERKGDHWVVRLANGDEIRAGVVVNAAGAWADQVAISAGAAPLGVTPKRRTMVQLRVGRSGLKSMPLVDDADGTFYFKGEGDSTVWLSPHDEIDTEPCDAAPEEIDVATAIDRFQQVVDWPIEGVERRWAGLRSFAPDRLPVYGFDQQTPGFFWCVGQGGFGIQTAPAAAELAAAVLLHETPHGSVDPAPFAPGRFR